MRLETTRFGALEIDGESVLTLTQPIIGFPHLRRFVLLPGPPGSSVKWLQSTEAGDVAFLLMDPRAVIHSYAVDLRDEELAELAVKSPTELEVYTLLVVPADPAQIRTNLKAPLLINPVQRLGKQTILDRKDYPIQHFLVPGGQKADTPEEAAHARTDA